MKPLRRTVGPCTIDGAHCVWCWQQILPDEQMVTLRDQTGLNFWHKECEQASIDDPYEDCSVRPCKRPALDAQAADDATKVDDGGTNPVLGLAFGIAMSAFFAVLLHGAWKFLRVVLQ